MTSSSSSSSSYYSPLKLLNTNSSQYTWTGNHFIPPKNVPTFSPMDYYQYFSKRNVLFIGDSTARRAYGTLRAMMTSDDYSNIPVDNINSPRVIDMNRRPRLREACQIKNRKLFNRTEYFYNYYVCHDLLPQEEEEEEESQNNINNTVIHAILEEPSPAAYTGKFDFALILCGSSIMTQFVDPSLLPGGVWSSREITLMTQNYTAENHILLKNTLPDLLQDYDLIVVGIGLWDVVRPSSCNIKNNNIDKKSLTLEERIAFTYDTFENISSPSFQVAFRTSGEYT